MFRRHLHPNKEVIGVESPQAQRLEKIEINHIFGSPDFFALVGLKTGGTVAFLGVGFQLRLPR